jgi:peptidoglycan/LPS O-acetylase OafA/YrhL
VIPASWTLLYEIIFYAVFAVLVLSRPVGIAAWFLLILASWGSARHHLLHPFNLPCIFGLAAAALCFRLRETRAAAREGIAATGFVLGTLLFVGTAAWYATLGVGEGDWPSHPLTILGFGAATALLALGSASPRIEAFFARRELLGLVGNASYSIYLIHLWGEKTAFKLIKAIYPLLADATGGAQIVADMLLIYIAIMAVLAGIAVHLKVERPLLALLREKMGAGGRE